MPLIYTRYFEIIHLCQRLRMTQSLLELLSSPSEDMSIKSSSINYLKYRHVQVSAINTLKQHRVCVNYYVNKR